MTEPRPTRDHTERMLRAAGARVEVEDAATPVTIAHPARPRSPCSPRTALALGEMSVPGDFSSAAFMVVAALLVRGSERAARGRRHQPDADRAARDPEPDGRRDRGRGRDGDAAASRAATIRARSGPLRGDRVGAGEVPLAIDELPLVALLRLLRRRRDRGHGRRGAAPQGIGPDRGRRRGAARTRRRDRGDRGRLRGHRHRTARAAARSTPAAITGWRCSARSPAWPRTRGSRSGLRVPPRSAIPASSATLRGCSRPLGA